MKNMGNMSGKSGGGKVADEMDNDGRMKKMMKMKPKQMNMTGPKCKKMTEAEHAQLTGSMDMDKG